MTGPETRAQRWCRILGGAVCLTAGGTYWLADGEEPWATWAFLGIMAGNFLVFGQEWWHLALRFSNADGERGGTPRRRHDRT